MERLQEITHAAYLCGVNVLCYQEACSELYLMPIHACYTIEQDICICPDLVLIIF